jgi:alcohol dehydrogenase, propanol-preferring
MLAYRLLADGPRLVDDMPVPTPGPGEIVIKVAGSGACHSDLHVIDAVAAGKSFFTPPFTLGHENTGWIEATGPDVRGLERGTAVAVYCAWGCGICRMCRTGAENYCVRQRELGGCGLGRDGGLAEYLLIPAAKYCVPLGDLDPYGAAPLTDAGLTAYHAINRSRDHLTPDASAVVIGIGGLGHLAVQILRETTAARIIAVDVLQGKLDVARELGANAVVRSDAPDAVANVLAALRGTPADVVFDFVGLQSTIDLGRKLVRPGGDFTIVGLGGGTMPYGPGKIAWGARVATPFYGTIHEMHELLALAASGRIRAHVTRYPLEHAADAYAALHDGSLDGRAVICPNG